MKIPLALVLASLAFLTLSPRWLVADAKVPGEIDVLNDEARAIAQKHIDLINKGSVVKSGEGETSNADADKARQECEKARRALLVMGPAVYPVIENALRLVPPPEARSHFNFLKALLAPKAEPELDVFRARARRVMLTGSFQSLFHEANELRMGKPDPKKPGKRIPPTIKPVKYGLGVAFRSADGSLVVAFGNDADEKTPDTSDFNVSEPAAGLVVGIGGTAFPFARTSGHGANVTVTASSGFAFAWATDGAPGKAPGGAGGEGGAASAKGGAGEYLRQGNGGAGAPADSGPGSPGMR